MNVTEIFELIKLAFMDVLSSFCVNWTGKKFLEGQISNEGYHRFERPSTSKTDGIIGFIKKKKIESIDGWLSEK